MMKLKNIQVCRKCDFPMTADSFVLISSLLPFCLVNPKPHHQERNTVIQRLFSIAEVMAYGGSGGTDQLKLPNL